MLTNEDLQAIATLLEPINKRLDKVDERLDKVDERLDSIEEQLEEVKENGEITRGATEEILKWLDKWYRNDFDKKFPVDDESAS